MGLYIIQQGDCVANVASRHGFLSSTLWNHAGNTELRNKRKDPNVLHPGDALFVPEPRERVESRSTDARYRFRIRGQGVRLRLKLMGKSSPRANERFTLEIDGTPALHGSSDSDGFIDTPIPPLAKSGLLTLSNGRERYVLQLGHIDPIAEVTGVQARLNNLGYLCGAVDGMLGPRTQDAIRAFQTANGLSADGVIGSATTSKLEQLYGG